MAPRHPAVFAYVVVDSTRTVHDATLPIDHAPQPPAVGDVIVYQEQHPAVIVERNPYGPVTDDITMCLVGAGRLVDGAPEFDRPVRRMLALLQIGARNEHALHGVVDQVFEKFQEARDTAALDDEQLERLRKAFP